MTSKISIYYSSETMYVNEALYDQTDDVGAVITFDLDLTPYTFFNVYNDTEAQISKKLSI